MYKSWVEWIDKQKRAHSKTSNVQITAKKIKEWLSSNFCQQLTNWSLTGHHQKWNAKVTMTNCHPRVLWFWPTEFLGAVLYSTLSLWIMSRSPSWQKQSQSLWLHSQVCVCVCMGGGGYSRFQVTGIIEGFFWVWNFWFRYFLGIQTIWIFAVVPMYPGN